MTAEQPGYLGDRGDLVLPRARIHGSHRPARLVRGAHGPFQSGTRLHHDPAFGSFPGPLLDRGGSYYDIQILI